MPIRSPASTFASPADQAACRALLRSGSRTFFAASLALPPSVRQAATGLYAFCRMADDAIDHGTDSGAALDDLRERLERIYAAEPADVPADRAFTDVVLRYGIPREFPQALLEGFEWDARNRRYETIAQLHAYAVRVAGVVGAMMAMVMGIRDAQLIARACDLGVAMQLTNIARDVGEDARQGRLYLPLQWLREARIDPEVWCGAPMFSTNLAGVLRKLLEEANTLYARSEAGLSRLPALCRPGMYAARLLYAEIGHELARRKFDSVNHRAVVTERRKIRLIATAMAAATVMPAARSASAFSSAVLPQATFLLASLQNTPRAARERRPPERTRPRRSSLSDRMVWVVTLFERLERSDRINRGERSGIA